MIGLIEEALQADAQLSTEELCELVSLSPATFYRRRGYDSDASDDTDLRDEIQRIAVDMSCYGYRRITIELHRRGYQVNHKRVLRMMRQDNLACT